MNSVPNNQRLALWFTLIYELFSVIVLTVLRARDNLLSETGWLSLNGSCPIQWIQCLQETFTFQRTEEHSYEHSQSQRGTWFLNLVWVRKKRQWFSKDVWSLELYFHILNILPCFVILYDYLLNSWLQHPVVTRFVFHWSFIKPGSTPCHKLYRTPIQIGLRNSHFHGGSEAACHQCPMFEFIGQAIILLYAPVSWSCQLQRQSYCLMEHICSGRTVCGKYGAPATSTTVTLSYATFFHPLLLSVVTLYWMVWIVHL
jgi:hypothetical protein